MVEENISQEFRLKNINKTRNYLIEEMNQVELMSEKEKMFCEVLNYTEHILFSSIIGCVSISPFASWIGTPIGTTSKIYQNQIKVCAITASIRKY